MRKVKGEGRKKVKSDQLPPHPSSGAEPTCAQCTMFKSANWVCFSFSWRPICIQNLGLHLLLLGGYFGCTGTQYVAQQKYFSHPNSVIYLFSNPIHETKTETANRCLAGELYCKMVHFRVLSESTPVQGSFLIIPQKWGNF
jgi:hypothetical protein